MAFRELSNKEVNDTDPNTQHIPNSTSLTDTSTYDEIYRHLWFLGASFEQHERNTHNKPWPQDNGRRNSPWYLHPRPITFPDAAQKENWRSSAEMFKFHCFSDLWSVSIPKRQKYRIALFVTRATSWVGKQWEDEPFHAWACLIGNGMAVIFDCNTHDDFGDRISTRRKELLSVQQQFLQYCEDTRSFNFKSSWLLGDGKTHRDGTCLQRTVTWIRKVIDPSLNESDLNYTTWPWDDEYMRSLGARRVRNSQSRSSSNSSIRSKERSAPEGYLLPQLRSRSQTPDPIRRQRKLKHRKSTLSTVELVEIANDEAMGRTELIGYHGDDQE